MGQPKDEEVEYRMNSNGHSAGEYIFSPPAFGSVCINNTLPG